MVQIVHEPANWSKNIVTEAAAQARMDQTFRDSESAQGRQIHTLIRPLRLRNHLLPFIADS